MQGMRNDYTDKQRSELVRLAASGRVTVSQAAAQLGIKPSTAYYWVRRAAPARIGRRGAETGLTEAPTFVRVVPSGDVEAGIAVRVGGAELQVRRGFDEDLLRAVVDALRGGAA
jgi:transposase-like protein